MRRFDEAITAHETARTVFHEQGDTHGEASAWNNLGLALSGVRRFDEAITAHETARTLFHEQGDTPLPGTTWA
ncbi:tetratricopeptide repeat protein [Streptomyces sp. YGL11-2]|uniref:tetratricopeptide repeat protein n=1 Tax=Streptomyces sp. YGL11-2 TaxID=3414028 RepID=UPI003CFA9D63